MVRHFLILLLLCSASLIFAQNSTVTILIDPGHGGKDPGHLPTSSNHLQEKELNLLIAKKVGHYLEHNLANVVVKYTRTTDVYPSLDDRVKMANDMNIDYMISIHCNGNDNLSILGTESHIHNYQSTDSYKWAVLVEKQFKSRAGRKSRGVKTGADIGHSLQILKYTKMPTILIECGFLTNIEEADYLNSLYGQEIISSAIFRATRSFLQNKHPDIDFTPQLISGPFYKVQIMSSIDPLDVSIAEFKRLGFEIERIKTDSKSMYKYKYFIGPFKTKKEAKKAQKSVQSKGYKDAFMVIFE